jgi:glutathione S-transferase
MTNLTFWGLKASPFQLKMQALADAAGISWQRWPDQAGTLPALGMLARLRRARRRRSVQRFPGFVAGMDEYPAVPFYTFDHRQFYYDSTGLALHIDSMKVSAQPLVPESSTAGFLCRLIDEAFDEFGLYMVHHNRWVTSASTNVMAKMTVAEIGKALPPFVRGRIQRKLAQRQVRRCPYLFSVAPTGYECGMPDTLTPPSRDGFPPTHELLDAAWRRYLGATEAILTHQPFVMGERFTLADASIYGQLGMNLVDGRAAELMEELAPYTYRWLLDIQEGGHRDSRGSIDHNPGLSPLVDCIVDTFVDLMRQNAAAYRKARAEGQILFNEAAFNRGQALYDGSLAGAPFRAVIKTFQVAVWQDICAAWWALAPDERDHISRDFPRLQDSLFTETVTTHQAGGPTGRTAEPPAPG